MPLNRVYNNFTFKRPEWGVFFDWKLFKECEDLPRKSGSESSVSCLKQGSEMGSFCLKQGRGLRASALPKLPLSAFPTSHPPSPAGSSQDWPSPFAPKAHFARFYSKFETQELWLFAEKEALKFGSIVIPCRVRVDQATDKEDKPIPNQTTIPTR